MTPQLQPATLKKAERIKSLKTIDELFKNGSSFFLAPFKVLYSLNTSPVSNAAFMVSKRNFKNATDRNRIKRLVRESWRINRHLLQTVKGPIYVQIIFIYTSHTLPGQDTVHSAMHKCIQKICSTEP